MPLLDLDEFRDRLTPPEQQLLKTLTSGPAAGGHPQPIDAVAAACGQPVEQVLDVLRMFADLEIVELREPEKTVRLRAAGILAARRPRTIMDRFALVGTLWGQLSHGTKRLAKIATGLIGLVVVGQVIWAIQAIVTAVLAFVHWMGK